MATPISSQPQSWMNLPPGVPNFPPGFGYLVALNQLIVQQRREMAEVLTGFETGNKYKVKNNMGQDVFYAEEVTDCCTRNCLGPGRPFEMKMMNSSDQQIMSMSSECGGTCCCLPICLRELIVCAPPGTIIGYVSQQFATNPVFSVQNHNRQPVFMIDGPCCPMGESHFQILTLEDQEVGSIRKHWSGFLKEAFTDADNFGITFPMDLDMNIKAVLLAACFLIDCLYFESNN